MSKEILDLQPKNVWKHFYSLTQIPRPSKKEHKVVEFMIDFGKSLGLETKTDEVGNVIIKKPATPGMEKRKGIILQGHLDMVPQKNTDVDFDFEKHPIQPRIAGEWVAARGTTLGADNGMGVAATMAVLESNNIAHGPIEALFTIDEETGMTGAFGLKSGLLNGDILLNLDSEDEGELYVGCAGGTNANILMKYREEAVPADRVAYKMVISGLKGGHSGLDIHLGRGNSNKILFRYLLHCEKHHGMRLSSIDGGNLRNAIPRDASAIFTIPLKNRKKFEKCVGESYQTVKSELSVTEPNLRIEAVSVDLPAFVMDKRTQTRLIRAVYGCPNGVIRMSDTMPGVVETSNNLSTIKSANGEIMIQCLMRSSVDTAKEDLGFAIESVFRLAGARVWFNGSYPGWKPNPDSAILKEMMEIYENKFGKVPEIKAIHAGLECGILGAVYPHWDMISFGPTIRHPHSPDEKVNIASVGKFWEYLVETLKNVPEK
ncbi:MAG: aminoacyl-histidine dipeptidase [Bacteroidales bacterium]|nr:aminoacyl-histidine dipeptidase [Bacteroidales bacterium]